MSLCFPGNLRTILNYRDASLDMIRIGHELRIYFHCWSETGLMVRSGNPFIEGSRRKGVYASFDQPIVLLRPTAFRIESPVRTCNGIIDAVGDVYLSGI